MRYLALVEREGESAFGVHFPDLPSVFSAADDADNVIPNAIEALRLWAEDEALPEPSSRKQITSCDDVADALAAGGYLIEVPLNVRGNDV